MAYVRFTDLVKNEVKRLPAPSLKIARRLFEYSVSCATAEMKIELVNGGKVIARYWVDYVENIPSVQDMPRYS